MQFFAHFCFSICARKPNLTSPEMYKLLALLLLFCFAKPAPAQDAAKWKKHGNELLELAQYQQALDAFLKAAKGWPADPEIRTNIGVCYYHLHQPVQAEEALLGAAKARKAPPPLGFLYLAKLHQARFDFEQAAIFYKQFLEKTPTDHPWRTAVHDELRRCATGLRVRRQLPFAAVLPLADLNSAADEFKPLPSPSGSERLYFSGRGVATKGSDVFFSEVSNGDWQPPSPLSVFVNSTENEMALGFDDSGSLFYFFRGGTPQRGQILVDTFREDPLERTLFFEAYSSPMRPDEGDCAPYFFNDSILLFASRRAGGLGGLDIYVSTRHDGIWQPAQNLGHPINSAYDDTSPFLARDGRTLYFSSNDAARSIGGLDILTANWLDWSRQWSQPVSLGLPINSAADDEHFTLSHNADRAFFSSNRITGEGGQDLYLALFDTPREEQLAQSWPVAFCLVAEGQNSPPSERAVQPPGSFFDEISSFELPVMSLPPLGGKPGVQSVKQFGLLAQLMKKYPQLRITIALHAAADDSPAVYFSFASQTATDLLQQEGASLQNLTLLFVGSSYPIAAEGNNRRAEIFVENPEVLPFALYRPPLPPEAMKAKFFQKAMSSLSFRVAVASGEELPKLFELYPDGLVEARVADGVQTFSPSIYLTHASAAEWQQVLVQDGYQHAKVAAYLNGRELSRAEAAEHAADFPDLEGFLRQ